MKRTAAVLLAILVMILPVAIASPAQARDYRWVYSAVYQSYDANSTTWLNANVDWYSDGVVLPVTRVQLARNSRVVLNRAGCAHVKISYKYLTGTVSWPPSAGTNTDSDGWYQACGARLSYIDLSGIAYAKHTLSKVTICIGWSRNATDLRRYDACPNPVRYITP